MRDRDRGAGSILAIAVVVLGLVLALSAGRLGHALAARARAETAADAAALGAADALALERGAVAARDAARVMAAANGARLVRCECSGESASVVVETDAGLVGDLPGPARASARAEVDRACGIVGCVGAAGARPESRARVGRSPAPG